MKKYIRPAAQKDDCSEGCIHCFGTFQVTGRSGKPVKWQTKKVEELFAYLLLHRGKRLDKWELGEVLWQDEEDKKITTNLHTTLFRLRKTLIEEGIDVSIASVKGGNSGYSLTLGQIPCDLDLFAASPLHQEKITAANIAGAERVLGLYRGELFSDLEYYWCIAERERMKTQYMLTAERVVEFYTKNNEHYKAVSLIQQILKTDPYDEKAHCMMMKAYVGLKDKNALAKHYAALKKLFLDEFDASLMTETTELYRSLMVLLK